MAMSDYLSGIRGKIGNDFLMIPSIGGIIFDDQKRVLLQLSAEDQNWYVPGGAIDPDEQPADALVREMREECGLIVEPVRIVAVSTSPRHAYPNGHRVQYVGIIFLCRVIGGELLVGDDESLEFRYFDTRALPPLRRDHQQWIEVAQRGREAAFFDPAGASPGR